MPKPIIKNNNLNSLKSLSFEKNQENMNKVSRVFRIDMDQYNCMLRKNRSKEYIETLSKLDTGEIKNNAQLQKIIEEINKELPEVKLYKQSVLLGIVSKCYLGYPYEVHLLDMSLNIVKHYKKNEVLPEDMERARSLAMNSSYKFIEVYNDCCRAVGKNGQVSVVFN